MADELVEYGLGEDFPGTMGKTIDDSTEAWPVPKRAPKGTPNVLFYVLDDTGFGQLSPYGGLIETPNLERIAIDDSNDLPTGDVTVVYEFEVTGKPELRSGKGTPGTGKLFVEGSQVGSVDMDVTVPFLFSAEGLSVGSDYGDSVDHDNYRTTFELTGDITQVTFDLSDDALDDADKLLRTEATNRHDLSKQ